MARNKTPRQPSPERKLSRLPDLGGLAAVTACVLLVLAPLVSLNVLLATSELSIGDSLTQGYPFRVLTGQALAHGHLPLWTDRFFCGYPLLADPAVGVFYPPTWLFAVLPTAPAMCLLLLGSCLLAGWGAYAYARSIGVSPVGSALAGMSFAVCGFLVSHLKHPGSVLCSAAWLPWQLWLVENAVAKGGRPGLRWAMWLAPVTALQVLAGGAQMVAISLLAAAVYAVVRLATVPGRPWRGRLVVAGVLAATVAVGVAMAAVQVLPSAELTAVSERSAGLAERDKWPLPARDLLTIGWSGAVGRAGDGSYWARGGQGIYWEDYAYVGWTICLLAVAGLPWTLRRGALGRLLAGMAAAGVLLALGERGGLWTALGHVPGFGYLRFPQRFLVLTDLALAVLAGLAWTRLAALVPGRLQWAAAGLVGALTVAALATAQGVQNQYFPAAAWLSPPATVQAVQGDSRVQVVLARTAYRQATTRGGAEGNLQQLMDLRALPVPCTGVFWDMPTASGYTELTTRWSAMLWHAQHGRSLAVTLEGQALRARSLPLPLPDAYLRLLAAAGTGWLISPYPLASPGIEPVEVPGRHVYRNRWNLGRAYLVPAAERLTDEAFLTQAAAGRLQFGRIVYLQEGEPVGTGDFPAVPVPLTEGETDTQVTLHPDAPAPAWLVLADAWYPGWTVTIDGRPADLYRANVNMRAVRVPAGRHEVVFRYRCRPLERGGLVAGAAALVWLLAVGGLAWHGRRRSSAG